MPMRLVMIDISLTRSLFTTRWTFSSSLVISATRGELTDTTVLMSGRTRQRQPRGMPPHILRYGAERLNSRSCRLSSEFFIPAGILRNPKSIVGAVACLCGARRQVPAAIPGNPSRRSCSHDELAGLFWLERCHTPRPDFNRGECRRSYEIPNPNHHDE